MESPTETEALPRKPTQRLERLHVAVRDALRRRVESCARLLDDAGVGARASLGRDTSGVVSQAESGDATCLEKLSDGMAALQLGTGVGVAALQQGHGAVVPAVSTQLASQLKLLYQFEVNRVECLLELLTSSRLVPTTFTADARALMLGVKAGDPACLEALLELGADVNGGDNQLLLKALHRCRYLTTHLPHAVSRNCPDAVSEFETITRILIEKGADVNALGDGGRWTPLLCTVCVKPENMQQKLIAAGANVNQANRFGLTPIMLTIDMYLKQVYPNLEMLVRFHGLVLAGADVNKPDMHGSTPLLLTLLPPEETEDPFWDTDLTHPPVERIEVVMKQLLAVGADVNAANARGVTPLRAALRSGVSVAPLLARGADVNQTVSTRGRCLPPHTLISEALLTGSVANLRLVLRHGARVDVSYVVTLGGRHSLRRSVHLLTLAHVAGQPVQLLMAEGGDTRAALQGVIPTYEEQVATPRSLQAQSRHAIRVAMVTASDVNLFVRVPQLPLPKALKEYVLYGLSV